MVPHFLHKHGPLSPHCGQSAHGSGDIAVAGVEIYRGPGRSVYSAGWSHRDRHIGGSKGVLLPWLSSAQPVFMGIAVTVAASSKRQVEHRSPAQEPTAVFGERVLG